MGIAIKHALAGTTPAPPTETSPAPSLSAPAAQASLKAKQLLAGRREAYVTRVIGEINTQLATRAHAQEHLSECIAEGTDTTAAADALLRAENGLRALESVLTIATQKHDAARAALEQAEQQEKIEKEVEVVAQLKRAMLKGDRFLADIKDWLHNELEPALNLSIDILTKSGIRDGELNFLTKVPLEFERHLLQAVHTLLRRGYTPPNMMGYEKWSDVAPDEDFIRSRPRPGPTMARMIPGWQGQD